MKKLVVQDKDSEIAYQLPSWAKQTQLGDNSLILLLIEIGLSSEKQRQKQ